METDRLKQFKTVVDVGSLRQAAEILHISPGGLSKSMQALEEDLGRPLFRPSGRGIAVTDFGLKVYEQVNRVLEAVEALKGESQPEAERRFRIGTFEVFSTYFLGFAFREGYAAGDWEVQELVPGRIEEALLNHVIDCGITYEPLPRSGIEYLKIKSVSMDIYTRRGSFDDVPLEELPFAVPITPLEGAPSGAKGLDGWRDDKRPRLVRFRVTMMETALELVRQGLCAAFLPCFVADLHNAQVAHEYALQRRKYRGTPSDPRHAYLVKRAGSEEDGRIKRLAQALRRVVY